MNQRPITFQGEEISEDFFNDRRRLRNGLVMLYHYLVEENWDKANAITITKVERIVRQNDTLSHSDWPEDKLTDDIENMANFSIIDFPKTYKLLSERSCAYNSSHLN